MISISYEESTHKPFPNEYFLLLETTIQHILKEHSSSERDLSLLICDNIFISKLNHQYRSKNEATDVLSFAFDDNEESPLPHSSLGDIIISYEKALDQASEYGVSYEEEFARLTIHGVLHLLGYDHEISEETHQGMFSLQDEYMQQFMKAYNGTDSALI